MRREMFGKETRSHTEKSSDGRFLSRLGAAAGFAHDEAISFQRVADGRAIVRQEHSIRSRTTGALGETLARGPAAASLSKN